MLLRQLPTPAHPNTYFLRPVSVLRSIPQRFLITGTFFVIGETG